MANATPSHRVNKETRKDTIDASHILGVTLTRSCQVGLLDEPMDSEPEERSQSGFVVLWIAYVSMMVSRGRSSMIFVEVIRMDSRLWKVLMSKLSLRDWMLMIESMWMKPRVKENSPSQEAK